MATVHPSALLRVPDPAMREQDYAQFLDDMKKVAKQSRPKTRCPPNATPEVLHVAAETWCTTRSRGGCELRPPRGSRRVRTSNRLVSSRWSDSDGGSDSGIATPRSSSASLLGMTLSSKSHAAACSVEVLRDLLGRNVTLRRICSTPSMPSSMLTHPSKPTDFSSREDRVVVVHALADLAVPQPVGVADGVLLAAEVFDRALRRGSGRWRAS